jgi:hypothetical protein
LTLSLLRRLLKAITSPLHQARLQASIRQGEVS